MQFCIEEKAMSREITSLTSFFESYLTWTQSVSGELATFTLLMGFVVLAALEFNYPKRRWPLKQLRQSYQTNARLFIFNSIVISLLSTTTLI